jgi:hypothetical protein
VWYNGYNDYVIAKKGSNMPPQELIKIGKESSKSGAQNQGLVSNLQAPDFVLSL